MGRYWLTVTGFGSRAGVARASEGSLSSGRGWRRKGDLWNLRLGCWALVLQDSKRDGGHSVPKRRGLRSAEIRQLVTKQMVRRWPDGQMEVRRMSARQITKTRGKQPRLNRAMSRLVRLPAGRPEHPAPHHVRAAFRPALHVSRPVRPTRRGGLVYVGPQRLQDLVAQPGGRGAGAGSASWPGPPRSRGGLLARPAAGRRGGGVAPVGARVSSHREADGNRSG